MIVEFAGPRGAGKSTLLVSVAQRLRDEGVEVAAHHVRWHHYASRWDVVRALARHPRLTARNPRDALVAVVRQLGWLRRIVLAAEFNRALRQHPSELVLVDNGLAFSAFLSINHLSDSDVRRLWKRCGSDLVLVASADAGELQRRLQERAKRGDKPAIPRVDKAVARHERAVTRLEPLIRIEEVTGSGMPESIRELV